jgi:hypothetical protein
MIMTDDELASLPIEILKKLARDGLPAVEIKAEELLRKKEISGTPFDPIAGVLADLEKDLDNPDHPGFTI